jgi:prepilin-type N-terminal cleavage/methylation domain-containing protein
MARGFTLIEVLIAGAILIVGAAGLLSAWSTTTALMETNRRVVEASALARSKAEELLRVPFLSLVSSQDHQVDGFGNVGAGPYEVQWLVVSSAALGGKKVNVDVTWRGKDGRPHNVDIVFARD